MCSLLSLSNRMIPPFFHTRCPAVLQFIQRQPVLLAVGDCVHQTGVREILIICQPEPVPDVILQSGIPMIQDKDGNGQFFVELCSDCHFEIHKRTATVQPPHRKPGFAAVAQIFGQAVHKNFQGVNSPACGETGRAS